MTIVHNADIEESLEGILELHEDVDEETKKDILASLADHVGNSDDVLLDEELEHLIQESKNTVESIEDTEWHNTEYANELKLAIQNGHSILE